MVKSLQTYVVLFWTFTLVFLLLPFEKNPVFHSFLNPKLMWLLLLGLFIFALFSFVALAGVNAGHDHGGGDFERIFKSTILLIPIPFIVTFSSAEYGSDVVENRMVFKEQAKQSLPNELRFDDLQTHPADTVYQLNLMELMYYPARYLGRNARTKGMIYRGQQVPDGYDYCFRYAMVCCAADTMPIGIFIPKQDSIPIENNSWYEVEGVVKTDTLDGYLVAALDSLHISQTAKPENGWLFPGSTKLLSE